VKKSHELGAFYSKRGSKEMKKYPGFAKSQEERLENVLYNLKYYSRSPLYIIGTHNIEIEGQYLIPVISLKTRELNAAREKFWAYFDPETSRRISWNDARLEWLKAHPDPLE
jgi:hypothetical protein